MKALILYLTLYSFTSINAQDCTQLPSTSFLETRLENLLAANGGEGSDPVVSAQDTPHYTCQVQGTTMGTYQELSVVMTYTTDTDSSPRIRQYELDCVAGSDGWQERSGSLSNILAGSFMDYITNLGTFTNCSGCNENAGNDNNCVACDSSCNVGLMRCTGSSSSDCCVAFENNECIADLNCAEDNFVADEQNNFTCACGLFPCAKGYSFNASSCTCYLTDICLADNPCANNGVCTLESPPNNYTCNCSTSNFFGVNCTECGFLPCPLGYTTNMTSCTCVLGNICQANMPCRNGGSCILGNAPDQYTCNCTGTNYTGPNCADCALDCPNGFVPDSDCKKCDSDCKKFLPCPLGYTTNMTSNCTCVLGNICQANMPCRNGGSCILGNAPDQYTCNCTGTNYTGPNCADCALDCPNGFVPDSDCKKCVRADVCEAFSPCQNGATCMSRPAESEYTCQCANYYTGQNCTDCGLLCLNGGTADRNCRSCDCAPGYTGMNCTECDAGYTQSRNGTIYTCTRAPRSGSSEFEWWWILIAVALLIFIVVVIMAIVITAICVYNKNKDSYVL